MTEVVFCLECSPLDYADYRMGDTVHEFMKDLYREITIRGGSEASKEWIGSEPIETDPCHLPGLFEAALLAGITDKEPITQGVKSVWILSTASGPERVVGYPIVAE